MCDWQLSTYIIMNYPQFSPIANCEFRTEREYRYIGGKLVAEISVNLHIGVSLLNILKKRQFSSRSYIF